jgi:hypothetical protein
LKVPGGDRALIPREKLTDYLLNSGHPDNGGKAVFFQSIGFCHAETELLALVLRQIATTSEIAEIVESVHGIKNCGRAD